MRKVVYIHASINNALSRKTFKDKKKVLFIIDGTAFVSNDVQKIQTTILLAFMLIQRHNRKRNMT